MHDNRRWPGVILSVLIPGFGLIRAGRYRRALLWFGALLAAGMLCAYAFAAETVPIAAAYGVLACVLVLQIRMLCDSFRPGKMKWITWVFFFIVLGAFAFSPNPVRHVARAFKMPTRSMQPTLIGSSDGTLPDHVIVNRLSYLNQLPKRGDIVAFATSGIPKILVPPSQRSREVFFVKRIIGLPGEKLQIRDGSVSVNGRTLTDADGIPPIHYQPSKMETEEYTVGPDAYFVIGDNFQNSYDSRGFGSVPAANLYGKVTKIYFPFQRMGTPTYKATNTEQSGGGRR